MIRGDALAEVAALVEASVETADELERSAAGHGWYGIAGRMSAVRLALAECAEELRAADADLVAGAAELAAVEREPHVGRIAALLTAAADSLRSARTLAEEVFAALRDLAEESAAAGARRLAEELDSARQLLGAALDALDAALRGIDADAARADDWISGSLPGVAAARPDVPPPDVPPHIRVPGNHKGPLGPDYSPGVHDPGNLFEPKERAIADWLLTRDPTLCIHPRVRDPASEERSPDAMIRRESGDYGTVTEFKTLDAATSNAVKTQLRAGLHQLLPSGNGNVVLDGRPAGLRPVDAQRGLDRFVGERRFHQRPLPDRVTIIMENGELNWRDDVG